MKFQLKPKFKAAMANAGEPKDEPRMSDVGRDNLPLRRMSLPADGPIATMVAEISCIPQGKL